MIELERDLRRLGAELAWPETPRFELALDRRAAGGPWLRPLALGLAVVLAVLGAVLAASPDARSAFLEIFRLQGATVERVESLPETRVRVPDYGDRLARAEAERLLGFELLDVEGAAPDSIHVRGRIGTLVYGDPEAPRLTLTQLRGGIFGGFVKKAGSRGTTIEEVEVDGEPGLFVSGDDHFVMFLDGEGEIRDEQTYLAGTVLLWNRDGFLFRLEGDVTREQALALAEDVG